MLQFDVAVIGSGMDGLTTAARLLDSGYRLLLVDSRFELGGRLSTQELTLPGFLHSEEASLPSYQIDKFHDFINESRPRRLRLAKSTPARQWAIETEKDEWVRITTDLEASAKSISSLSAEDSQAYARLRSEAEVVAADHLIPALRSSISPGSATNTPAYAATELQRRFKDRSPVDIVREHFSDERVQGLVLYTSVVTWGLDPYDRDLGEWFPLLLHSATDNTLQLGGTFLLAREIEREISRRDGRVLTSTRVERVERDGKCKVIRFHGGNAARVTGDVFITSELRRPQDFMQKAEVHLALKDDNAFRGSSQAPKSSLNYLIGYRGLPHLLEHVDAVRGGRWQSEAGFVVTVPSLFDPSLSPQGRHVGLISQIAPEAVYGVGTRDTQFDHDDYRDRMLADCSNVFPGLSHSVLWSSTRFPLEKVSRFDGGPVENAVTIPPSKWDLLGDWPGQSDDCRRQRVASQQAQIGDRNG